MSTTATSFVQIAGVTPGIPESDYWLVAAGYLQRLLSSGTCSTVVSVEVAASEAHGAGWRDVYSDTASRDLHFLRGAGESRWAGSPFAEVIVEQAVSP